MTLLVFVLVVVSIIGLTAFMRGRGLSTLWSVCLSSWEVTVSLASVSIVFSSATSLSLLMGNVENAKKLKKAVSKPLSLTLH